jgi:uncharacterized protein (TIGR04540 family)
MIYRSVLGQAHIRYIIGSYSTEQKKYQNANETAKAVKTIIDEYWCQNITKEQARQSIKGEILIIPENRARIFRGEKYTAVFENVLGKKRLAEFASILTSE